MRFDLLQMLVRYFQANPSYENPQLKVTAPIGTEILVELAARRTACAEAIRQTTQTKEALDTALEAVRKRLRGLIDELHLLLSDSDPLWYAFGLNAPADPSTPSAPDGLHFQLNGTTAYMEWADSRRAERYRIWKQTDGVDEGFVSVGTVWESDYIYSDLPAGKVTRIQVTAINAAGESQGSAPVEIAVA